MVAAVREASERLVVSTPIIKISGVNTCNIKLSALVDTGSPVSFIKFVVYNKIKNRCDLEIRPANRKLKNLSNVILNIIGTVKVKLTLAEKNSKVTVDLFVLRDATFDTDLILGREFLRKGKLTFVYTLIGEGDRDRVSLFADLPLCVEGEVTLEKIIEQSDIDFDNNVRQKLINVITEVRDRKIESADDDYAVRVRLRDESVYAYAPHRFTYAERLQIRAITDDLL